MIKILGHELTVSGLNDGGFEAIGLKVEITDDRKIGIENPIAGVTFFKAKNQTDEVCMYDMQDDTDGEMILLETFVFTEEEEKEFFDYIEKNNLRQGLECPIGNNMNIVKVLTEKNIGKMYKDCFDDTWIVVKFNICNMGLVNIFNEHIEDKYYLDDILKLDFTEVAV